MTKTTPTGVAADAATWDLDGIGALGTLPKGVKDMKQDNRGLLAELGVLVLTLLLGPLLMGGMMGPGFVGPGMMGWGYATGAATTGNGWVWGLGMALGGLMMLVFWGALIVGVVLLVRWATGHSTIPSSAEDPLAILRRR